MGARPTLYYEEWGKEQVAGLFSIIGVLMGARTILYHEEWGKGQVAGLFIIMGVLMGASAILYLLVLRGMEKGASCWCVINNRCFNGACNTFYHEEWEKEQVAGLFIIIGVLMGLVLPISL